MPHALAVLFTVAGTPSVYAGDELGYTGIKEQRIGGDDAVRPQFPPHPPAPDELDPVARHLLDVHRELVALRRRYRWLHDAHTDVVHLTNRAIVLRTATGEGAVVTALNIDDEPVELPAAAGREVAAGAADLDGDTIRLPARGWVVLTA